MIVVIIDCGSGNLRSVTKALEHAAAEAGVSASVQVTRSPDEVLHADRIVLPGQGAFASCLAGLQSVDGLREALDEAVHVRGKPYFGICVGMQLMADVGEEHGEHAGFGWIPGRVVPLKPSDPTLKIPHMGWNSLDVHAPSHPMLANLPDQPHVYFVHSYQLSPANPADCLASADYGGPVTAVVGRDNLIGTQFHPEKSQAVGLNMLQTFLRWEP
jgi:glutamine amidotransferase